MKKLSLTAVVLLIIASTALAHEGSLGLYTSDVATDCDVDPVLFVPFDIYMVYIKSDAGPDGITAFEFKLEKNSDNVVLSGATWQQGFVPLGDIESGISVATPGCYGSGLDVVPLGTISTFVTATPIPADVYLLVVEDPAIAGAGVIVTTCETGFPIRQVLGGMFKFQEGLCNIGVEPTSWGAIKVLLDE
jgi:hypothetical protein